VALNRDERIQMLGALLEKNHPRFAQLVQHTPNIAKEVKIDLLSQHVTLLYGDDPDAIRGLLKVLAIDSGE
jgi:hypothetical protein